MRIVKHENLRPISDLDSLVGATGIPDFVIDRTQLQRLVTCEGKRAFVVSGVARGAAIELGFVLLDGTYIRYAGHGDDREAVAAEIRRRVLNTRAEELRMAA